jgi:4-carboxymuconolactone decarboxylase
MTKSDLYKKGEAVRRQLMGDAGFNERQAQYAADPMMTKFIDVATETIFGALWSRPGIDTKTRTLICVVSDTTMGRHEELEIHLRFALKEGWTEEELTEVLLHLLGYIGAPLVREAMLCAKKVFADERKKTGKG